MSETDSQLGGGYTYQWECALLLALNYFFEPVRYNPTLFDLVEDFLGQVAEIHLEGKDRESGVDLEDVALVSGDRRILVQVKTKQAEGERWTPSDDLLLKALYRFYGSPFLDDRPDDTRFVFLTNRSFNPDLVRVKSAVEEGTVAECTDADKLCRHLDRYARKGKKGKSIAKDRFHEMLARTALVEYLAVDEVKANVQRCLRAYGRRDWEQAHAVLFEDFARRSTRKGGGTVTRASVVEVLGPPPGEALDAYLARAVADFERRMYQIVARPTAPPDRPYKFLYPFEIEDADVFFGRDAAGEDLYQALLKDRLTVLHARSGAGKTSLLSAGLSPRLIREGRLPVYARSYEDPVLAVKRAIASPSLGPWPELLPKLTLHEFLGRACAHLSRQTQELVIVLDQFEEFFVFWPERDHRRPFVEALADCYGDRSLPVRFVIGIRGDYFTHLATFQDRLPHIFNNEYYLDAMTREEAQEAITGPVAKLDRPLAYDQDLLDTLLDDLARSGPVLSAAEGIELPHLQIICTRLYEALAEGETTITLASYEKLGRAEGVLGGYLNDVLDRMPGRGGSIAKEVLKELVSSEATRRVLGYGPLAARVEAEGDELAGVLARLVDARLLRRDEVAGEITYEMAHEYLIEEIKKWIDLADLEFKRAEELLMREVASWRVHGTLIPRDRLELLYEQREHFKGLGDEAWECILHSALQADFAVEDWVRLAGKASEKSLLSVISDEFSPLRARVRAGNALGQIGDPRFHGPYLEPEVITIPEGDFWMGNESEAARDAEKPAHKVHVPEFQMAKYPVTNAQFKCFVEGGGYDQEEYWTEAGWAWRQEESEGRRRPRGWKDGLFPPEKANHPVVTVTWYEALAYTRWLAEVTGKSYRLPSEAEWEKAARGSRDRREYPWGDQFDHKRVNMRIGDDQIGDTSLVGIYPGGASPYGILDLSGNVLEWCSSLFRDYPYEADDGREDLRAEGGRVLRGGSWFGNSERYARCSYRFSAPPSFFRDGLGFRILVSAALSA